MTTSQNAPAPHNGRHRRPDVPGRPVAYTGPSPVNQPQSWPRQDGPITGYGQQQPQIPAQWNPGTAGPPSPAYSTGSNAGHNHTPYAYAAPVPPQQTPDTTAFAPTPPPRLPAAEPVQVFAPRNGLGIAALCLGIVGMLFGLVPFTGFIAFALGAIGIILGLVGFARARRRTATNTKTAVSGVVLSALAIALGIWGMVIVFTGLSQLSEDLNQISSPTGTTATGGTALPADVTTPAVGTPVTYQLEITGDASKMMVAYGTNNAVSSTSDYQSLPWRKTVEAGGDMPYATVTGTSFGPGSITCTITNTATGAVVSTQTSKSLDDSEYSSATVSCNSMG